MSCIMTCTKFDTAHFFVLLVFFSCISCIDPAVNILVLVQGTILLLPYFPPDSTAVKRFFSWE